VGAAQADAIRSADTGGRGVALAPQHLQARQWRLRLPDLGTPQLVTDCSGFAAICLGRSRNATGPDLGDLEWIETTQLVRDATGPQRLVRAVSLDDLLPGDLIAHGDSGGRQGHVAVFEFYGDRRLIHTIESCGATATESSIRRRERTKRWRSKGAIGLRPVWYA
jgi:hypothetical protein